MCIRDRAKRPRPLDEPQPPKVPLGRALRAEAPVPAKRKVGRPVGSGKKKAAKMALDYGMEDAEMEKDLGQGGE
eukprot:8904934-Heterocapsa_arctica.AAC.1